MLRPPQQLSVPENWRLVAAACQHRSEPVHLPWFDSETSAKHAAVPLQGFAIKKGAEVTVTTSSTAQASSSCLPITYPNFHTMVSPGDTVFVGRRVLCCSPCT